MLKNKKMTINLVYMCVIVIAMYYGIRTYIAAKHRTIMYGLGILGVSFALEIRWMNTGNYIIDTSDIFRTMRDILRTILIIIGFRLFYKSQRNTPRGNNQ